MVRALTGMEPDRWAEERRRGMTIDLGFAWTTLGTGDVLAFVDVPGHQRFVSNMLAGIGPVAAVLFVVAADQGWSRQSAEHLSALHALEVGHGLLAVTRSDLGDPELAEAEAREHLAGTPLAGVEAVAVSAVTGAGLDELRAALARLVAQLPPPPPAPTRLWIDRAFTVRGAGTVVTGTLGSGSLAVGEELTLSPSGATVRVRGLQSLQASVTRVDAVARVAVNLRGVALDDVHRGHALLAPDGWNAVDTLDVRLVRAAERLPPELTLHVGSAAVPARVRRLGPAAARLTLRRPLPLRIGERALLRDPGQQRIAAGVVVLDPRPPTLDRRGGAARRAVELAGRPGDPDAAGELRRRGAVRRSWLRAAGALDPGRADPDDAVACGDWLVEPRTWRRWAAALTAAADEHARAHPLTPGLPAATAVRRVGLPDPALLDPLVAASSGLVRDADGVHRPAVTATLPPAADRALEQLRARLRHDPFAAPEAEELTRLGLSERHLAIAARNQLLLRLDRGVFVRPDSPAVAVEILSTLEEPFTVSQARQRLGTTRRVALPLLALLDREGLTRRVDENRRVVAGDRLSR